jgi:hypothetical protein
MHLPLPAKIRTRFLEPIRVDSDTAVADDQEYVDSVYRDVEAAIQDRHGRAREAAQVPGLRLSRPARVSSRPAG